MTNQTSNIFISGNLDGLTLCESLVEKLIFYLIETEPNLKTKLMTKPINISFMSLDEIKRLNYKFANKDKPTNVLSFPTEGVEFTDETLGDIAVCPEIIIEESIKQGKDKQSHLIHIILHSILHLVGFQHGDRNSASKMESLEVNVLKKLGIANPY